MEDRRQFLNGYCHIYLEITKGCYTEEYRSQKPEVRIQKELEWKTNAPIRRTTSEFCILSSVFKPCANLDVDGILNSVFFQKKPSP